MISRRRQSYVEQVADEPKPHPASTRESTTRMNNRPILALIIHPHLRVGKVVRRGCGMGRLTVILGVLTLVGGLVASCGDAGSAPAEAGSWSVWSPDRDADVPTPGLEASTVQLAHFRSLVDGVRGNPDDPELAGLLRPSLYLMLFFEEGEASTPSLHSSAFRLQCGSRV